MCSATCGMLPDQEWNLCLLHWQADFFLPLSHQESPNYDLWQISFCGVSLFGDVLFFPSGMFFCMKNLYYLTYCSKHLRNSRKRKIPVRLTSLWNIFDIYLYTYVKCCIFSLCAVNSSVLFLQRSTNTRQSLSGHFCSHFPFPNSLL